MASIKTNKLKWQSLAGIIHGINETEVQHIITSFTLAQKLSRLKGELGRIKHVIILDCEDEEKIAQLQDQFGADVLLFAFSAIVQNGDSHFYSHLAKIPLLFAIYI